MVATISSCDLRMRHCEDFRHWSTRHWLELCFVLILLQSCWLAGKQLDFHLGYYWPIDHLFYLNILSLFVCFFGCYVVLFLYLFVYLMVFICGLIDASLFIFICSFQFFSALFAYEFLPLFDFLNTSATLHSPFTLIPPPSHITRWRERGCRTGLLQIKWFPVLPILLQMRNFHDSLWLSVGLFSWFRLYAVLSIWVCRTILG